MKTEACPVWKLSRDTLFYENNLQFAKCKLSIKRKLIHFYSFNELYIRI